LLIISYSHLRLRRDKDMEIFRRHEKLLDLQRLKSSSVLVVGAGGLGSPVLEMLCRVGVGKLVVAENASVDEPDLNRQILYTREDLGKSKLRKVVERLKGIRPDLEIEALERRVDEGFELPKVDCVALCVDNFETRLLVDEKASAAGIPVVNAGIKGYYGQVNTVLPGRTVNMRRLFKNARTEREIPVYPPTALLVGTLQAHEVIEVLLDRPQLAGKMLIVDLLNLSFEVIPLMPE